MQAFTSPLPGRRLARCCVRVAKLLVLTTLVVIAACRGGHVAASSSPPSATAEASVDNGKLIFQTGRDSAGKQITAEKPPLRPYCAACHGTKGAGGVKLPDGAVSADLRYSALVTGQKHPYTLSLLERAITTGVDNDGKTLDPVMPRWRLSAGDLTDVAAYILNELK